MEQDIQTTGEPQEMKLWQVDNDVSSNRDDAAEVTRLLNVHALQYSRQHEMIGIIELAELAALRLQYSRQHEMIGYIDFPNPKHETELKPEYMFVPDGTPDDLLAQPFYDDIVFLVYDINIYQALKTEGRAGTVLKESDDLWIKIHTLYQKDKEKYHDEIAKLHEIQDNLLSQAPSLIRENIDEYQRSLIEKHAGDPDFLVRLANSIKICAALVAGRSKAALLTLLDKKRGAMFFNVEHDVDNMTAEEKARFYPRLLETVNIYSYGRVNQKFLKANNFRYCGMQTYLSYIEEKDKAFYKALSQWIKETIQRATWSRVTAYHVRTWLEKHPKEEKSAKSEKKASSSGDDAKPPDEVEREVEQRISDLIMKPSSTALRAVKGSLGSGFDAERLKQRIEDVSHTDTLTELEDDVDFSILIEKREKGKRKSGTAVRLVNLEENFSTMKRRSPVALDYFDFITTKALDNAVAGGELIKEELVIPYDDFLTENGGLCQSKGELCKAIGRYGPILKGLLITGEYEPINPNNGKESLTEHDIVGPIRRITNRNGYVRILFEREFRWDIFFRYRYPYPPYFWKIPTRSRRILDRLLETARIAGSDHRNKRSAALRKEHIFTATINSAILNTDIPTPNETDHPRRKIIEPIIDAIKRIQNDEAQQNIKDKRHRLESIGIAPDEKDKDGKTRKTTEAELDAKLRKVGINPDDFRRLDIELDETARNARNINDFMKGHIILHVYGQFADDLLAQPEKRIKKIQANARKAERRKENVEYRLAKNAAKNQ